ncbi:MAG: hypothetical protein ACN6N0_17975, partial [Microvirgula sp.]
MDIGETCKPLPVVESRIRAVSPHARCHAADVSHTNRFKQRKRFFKMRIGVVMKSQKLTTWIVA